MNVIKNVLDFSPYTKLKKKKKHGANSPKMKINNLLIFFLSLPNQPVGDRVWNFYKLNFFLNMNE